jgi:hypothetical protein
VGLRGIAAIVAIGVGCGDDAGRCELGARLDSIDDAIATIDRLPLPVTLPCFLASIERPLGLELTSDVFNTQPAEGYRSPRILVRLPRVTLTVVPVREGKHLLELGEDHPSGLTVKADLHFPIASELDPQEPFVRTLAYPGASETGCHVCHFEEIALDDGRFANTQLRPPDEMIVPLDVLRDEHAACDRREDPYRCRMFSALLDHGDVFESRFPETVATQFGPQP